LQADIEDQTPEEHKALLIRAIEEMPRNMASVMRMQYNMFVKSVVPPVFCECGYCCDMPTPAENICCMEDPCISKHHTFYNVCMRPDVMLMFVMFWGLKYNTNSTYSNRKMRYMAYKMFTTWQWGILNRREPVPACAVHRIRLQFPEPDGDYTGFKSGFNSDVDD
jgi:hypothetical protein